MVGQGQNKVMTGMGRTGQQWGQLICLPNSRPFLVSSLRNGGSTWTTTATLLEQVQMGLSALTYPHVNKCLALLHQKGVGGEQDWPVNLIPNY